MNDASPSTRTLASFVQRAGALYSLPAVAVEVIELTNSPKVDVRAMKECLENDPALATKILRVVNSSLFGLSREVSDLNQALALLGTKPLKLLVLGFSLPRELFSGLEADAIAAYWRHTLTKAVAAREISETLWERPGDEPFIAGLLQDIGLLVLLQDLGQPFAEFLRKVAREGADLTAMEIAALGFDHTVLSAELLDRWGLPKSLVRAVLVPPDANRLLTMSDEEENAQHRVLHLAELVARLLADNRPENLSQILWVGREYKGLSEQQLADLAGRLQEKVEQLADVLSLELPDRRGYLDVLADAQSQLAEVADSVAGQMLARPDRDEQALLHETKAVSDAVKQFIAVSTDLTGPVMERTRSETKNKNKDKNAQTPSVAVPAAARPAKCAGRAAAVIEVATAVDPGYVGRVRSVVRSCRQARCAVSVVLVQLDHFTDLAVTRGIEGAERMLATVEWAAQGLCEPGCYYGRTAEGQFGLILGDYDRRQAVELGWQLVDGIRQWSRKRLEKGETTVSLSVGIATVSIVSKNFPPEELVDAAGRCLYGAQSASGDNLKSIAIY